MAHKHPTVSMQLTDEQKKSLRKIAKQHGLLIGRGSQAKWGSIRGLNEAIASGKLLVVPNPERSADE